MNKKCITKIERKKRSSLKYKNICDLMNKIVKTTSGEIRLRSNRVTNSLLNKNARISKLENYHETFKEAIIKYHKNCIEKNDDEKRAFLSAIEGTNMNGPPLSEILEKHMITAKKVLNNNNEILPKNDYDKYQKEMLTNRNISTVTLSPISPCRNLSTMLRNNDNSKFGDISSYSIKSGLQSPISLNGSISSCMASAKNVNTAKFNQHHALIDNKVMTNKSCNYCKNKDTKTPMYKCRMCGIYIHKPCRELNYYKICIPVTKTALKLANNRTLKLSDINVSNYRPMVPEMLLVMMHHIHMFGLKTEHIYTRTGKVKEAKDLCNKLLEGKSKYLIKNDIFIVTNALIMFLESTSEPILPQCVVNELIDCMDGDAESFLSSVVACLKKMPLDSLDTLIYVLLHLKVIAANSICQFDSDRLANTFSSILSDRDSQNIQVIKMLIELDIKFYSQHFLTEKVFFKPYFQELSQ